MDVFTACLNSIVGAPDAGFMALQNTAQLNSSPHRLQYQPPFKDLLRKHLRGT